MHIPFNNQTIAYATNNWFIGRLLVLFFSCSLLDDIKNSEEQQPGQQEQQEFVSSLETIALTIFLSLIIIMTVFGNLLVMVALCKDRHLRWALLSLSAAAVVFVTSAEKKAEV